MKPISHDTVADGIRDMLESLQNWNKNPRKVYILGKRVHHGPLCGLLALAGIYYKIPYLAGAGITGALDDIYDADHWLDFESGGDPNSLIDIV